MLVTHVSRHNKMGGSAMPRGRRGRRGWNLRGPHKPVLRGPAHPGWRGDAISVEGARKRARRLYALGCCADCDAPARDRHHVDGNPRNNAPANVIPLCRRCHMARDGRLARFPMLPRRARTPPRPCIVCAQLAKPLRRGRCHACNERHRRHGYDVPPPPPNVAFAGPCLVCGRVGSMYQYARQRCGRCYQHLYRHGVDRPLSS